MHIFINFVLYIILHWSSYISSIAYEKDLIQNLNRIQIGFHVIGMHMHYLRIIIQSEIK
jgi:hypothetical protein